MTAHPIDRDWDRLDALVDEDPIALRDAAWRLTTALAAAEHRATRAEEQSEARRLDIEYWKGVARGNALTADVWKESAEEAEARIKAVKDVLDESEARGPVGMTFNGTPFPAWVSIATIRRALDVDA